jgi:DNA-binding NarL/FixJ family response regulator
MCFFEIRKIDSMARIVLSSGFTRSDDLADLRAVGLAGFISKPFRGADLSHVIAEALAADECDGGERMK